MNDDRRGVGDGVKQGFGMGMGCLMVVVVLVLAVFLLPALGLGCVACSQ